MTDTITQISDLLKLSQMTDNDRERAMLAADAAELIGTLHSEMFLHFDLKSKHHFEVIVDGEYTYNDIDDFVDDLVNEEW